jgi:hypothetical protein
MKQCLLGVCNNVGHNIDKVKVWAKSFVRHTDNPNVFLIAVNATDEEIKIVKDIGIIPIPVTMNTTVGINHTRLRPAYQLLELIDCEQIVYTDVFDVVFQGNPFLKLDFNNNDLFAGEEGLLIRNEPWNMNNIQLIFPEELDKCLNNRVLCSGVMAGNRKAFIDLLYKIYVLSEHGQVNHDNIRDQAALHVLYANNRIKNLKTIPLTEFWTVHCAVAGPTPFFESWNFKNHFQNDGLPIPYLEDGIVKGDGQPFDIVHQYNRVPEWYDKLIQPYV